MASFSPEFLAHLKRIVPPGLLPEVLRGYATDRPTTFRINTLKASVEAVLKDFKFNDLSIRPVRDIPSAHEILKGSHKKLVSTKSYEEGLIYLQSLSSQLPPLVLTPRPGETILDMAAAPGGKTCQMAAMMKNEGRIFALEPDPIRHDRLAHNVKVQGATCVTVVRTRGEKFVPPDSLLFDRILLDAPCSSEGTFSSCDPQSFRHWSEDFVLKKSSEQKKLAHAAAALLKPGGFLLYSTCALSPEENESVMEDLLTTHPEMQILDIPKTWPFLKPSLAQWNGIRFKPAIGKARRVYPSPVFEGFFLCLLQKLPGS